MNNLIKARYFLILLISTSPISLSYSASSPTYDEKKREVSNWNEQSLQGLLIHEAGQSPRDVSESDFVNWPDKLRCIKMNNYWCIKDVGWNGTIGTDRAGHSAFSFSYYSARAIARDLRSKYERRGLKTAWEIISRYADPDSCVGDIRNPDGTCRYGRNPTKQYAVHMIRGITDSINEDLNLFDNNGNPTENLSIAIQNMSHFELAPFFSKLSVIKKGIELERN